jgi:hypothetical protein
MCLQGAVTGGNGEGLVEYTNRYGPGTGLWYLVERPLGRLHGAVP